MTTTVTSAKELLDSGDVTFCALLSVWQDEGRCPLPLVDLLLEYGLADAAEAARWAATEPDRHWTQLHSGNERSYGPMPWFGDGGDPAAQGGVE